MAYYRVMSGLMSGTGIPADTAWNNWTLQANSVGQLEDGLDAIAAFYLEIDGILSPELAGDLFIKAYDLSDPEPRVPVYDETVTGFAVAWGTGILPMEVAMVGNFQAVKTSGQPQARRRGRHFIGPLAASTVDSDARPSSAARSTLATAYDTFHATAAADTDWSWWVHSETYGTYAEVNNGWVPNEFATVRSRGQKALVRTTWTS